MAFKRPSLPELLARVDQDVTSRLSASQASLAVRLTKVMSAAEAGVAHGLYGYLQWLEKQLFPETCDDDLLHLHSAGVPRRLKSRAVGEVIFEGSDDAIIIAGTLLSKDGIDYATTSETQIADGTATAPVEAVLAGAAGNQPAGAELRLVSPIAGVVATAAVGADGIQGGADLETFGSWRDRIMLRRARTPRGGAMGDWEEWALQVAGVTRAWEDPLGMGPGSVVIRIMADDTPGGPLPSEQLLQAVFDHITKQKNVQAHIYVVAPGTQLFNPQLSVTPNTEAVRVAASKALQDLVEREGEPGGILLISRIRAAISLAPGVEDYDLNLDDDIVYDTGVIPLWGGVEWV
jgi:uncharacterized phage protein gp47/JayE